MSVYLNNFIHKLSGAMSKVLVLALALAILIPTQLVEVISVKNSIESFENEITASTAEAQAVGGSGSIEGGGGHKGNGGAVTNFAGIAVSLVQGEQYLVNEEHSVDEFISNNEVGYPTLDNSMFMIDNALVRDWRIASYYGGNVLNYITDTSKMLYVPAKESGATLSSGSGHNQGGGVFFSAVLNRLTTDKEKFVSGGWQDYLYDSAPGVSNPYDSSMANWGWILSSLKTGSDSTTSRVNKCYNTGGYTYNNMDEWKNDPVAVNIVKARYLDMLFQLFRITGTSSQFQSGIRSFIEAIVKGDSSNPMAISITPLFGVTADDGEYLVMKTFDFFNFYTGTSINYKLDNAVVKNTIKQNPSEWGKGHFYAMFKNSVDRSIIENGNLTRISDTYSSNNVFSHSASAISSEQLWTKGGNLHVLTGSSNRSRYHEYLYLVADQNKKYNKWSPSAFPNGSEDAGAAYGFNLVYYMDVQSTPETVITDEVSLKALPDDKMLPQPEVGEVVPLGENVTLKLTPEVWKKESRKNNWLKVLESTKEAKPDFILKVDISRSCNIPEYNGQILNLVSGGTTIQSTGADRAYYEKHYGWNEMRSMLESNADMMPMVDITSGYILPNRNDEYDIIFTYKTTPRMEYVVDGELHTAWPDMPDPKTQQDTASFKVPKRLEAEDLERLRYTSEPEAYAELKNYGHGSNQSGTLSEDYEVMAGVPTTEQLYYAVGGSEFIVDISLEYEPNNESTRSYTSYFAGTTCEYHGVGRDGMTQKNTGTYSESGSADGDISGSWSVYTTNSNIQCGCGVCGGGGDWTVTIHAEYANEVKFHTCAGGENTQIHTNGSKAYNDMLKAIAKIEKQMDDDAKAFTYTAASDGKTRKGMAFSWSSPPSYSAPNGSDGVKGCGANHDHCGNHCNKHPDGGDPPSMIDLGDGCGCWGSPCNTGSQGKGSITITGTWTSHHICGPCCSHHLPEIYDTWDQSWNFDSVKITDVHVWRIDQGSASGLEDVIGPGVDNLVTYKAGRVAGTYGAYNNPNSLKDGVVGASIKSGTPNIFYNIAMLNSNDLHPPEAQKNLNYKTKDGVNPWSGVSDKSTEHSTVGRLRYNINSNWTDANQHDQVYYNLGTRTNKCDGLSTTYPGNDISAGGKGHGEKWAPGFIYNGFKGGSSTHGSTSAYAGHKNYPLDHVYYLQEHCDGVDSDFASFYNKASDYSSNEGRLDINTTEYARLKEKRQQRITVTQVTDYLILQTSSGDQSVMYYQSVSDSTAAYNKNSKTWMDKYNPKTGVAQATPGATLINVTVEAQIPRQERLIEQMWHNNSKSAAKWKPSAINVGGYNGKYSSPNTKFKGTGTNQKVATLYDNDPAHTIVRPTRPTKPLMVYSLPLNIIAEISNENYMTGNMESEVFWTNNLHWSDKLAKSWKVTADPMPVDVYSTDKTKKDTTFNYNNKGKKTNELKTRWGQKPQDVTHSYQGYVLDTKYSKQHNIELNPLIIQDPISSTNAALISLPDSRDQRYSKVVDANTLNDAVNKLQVCPGTAAECEFAVLDCHYGDNQTLAEYNFNSGGMVNGVTKNSISLPTGWGIDSSKLSASGSATRITIPMQNELGLSYQATTQVEVTAKVNLTSLPAYTDASTGAVKTRISQMLFGYNNYGMYVSTEGHPGFINSSGQYREATNITLTPGTEYSIDAVFSFNYMDGCELRVNGTTAIFTSSSKDKIKVVADDIGENFYIGSMKAQTYGFRGIMDDVVIARRAGSYSHTEDCYTTQMTHPSGINAHVHTSDCLAGGTTTTTRPVQPVQTNKVVYTSGNPGYNSLVLTPGTYKIEAWGAEGGGTSSTGGKGGYSVGTYTVANNTTVYPVVGGAGVGKTGGYNGGATGNYGGGGGMSHVNKVAPSTTSSSTSGTGNVGPDYYSVFTMSAATAGTITFWSTSHTKDPRGVIMVNGRVIVDNDDSGGNLNFKASANYNSGDVIELATYRYGNNGGGTCTWHATWTGGGINPNISSSNTIIVAGGGGGGAHTGVGGYGGGTSGGNGASASGSYGRGGSQSSAGYNGSMGVGGTDARHGGGGGGGYYGGGGGGTDCEDGGGGGSGYIGGVSSEYGVTKQTLGGNQSFKSPSGGSETGHSGNGYIKITQLYGYPDGKKPGDMETVTVRDGYDKYKEMYERGQLSIEELKAIFGDAYDLLFQGGDSLKTYSSFTDLSRFSNASNCDLVAYSGNILSNVTGTAPSFVFRPDTITASDTGKITVRLNNNTGATQAKMYWSTNTTFTENKSVTTVLQPNKSNQDITFYVSESPNWSGTVNYLKFVIPSNTDKNYSGSVQIISIGTVAGAPAPANFSFATRAQSYTVPVSGYYRLETWGASAGNSGTGASDGGYGGYTEAVSKLTKGQTLYVYTGGQGSYAGDIGEGAGYNGGGSGGPGGYGGGGMTHITFSSNDSIKSTTTMGTTTVIEHAAGSTVWSSSTPNSYALWLKAGKYTFKVYGAQGGGSYGGLGGYSYGTVEFNSPSLIYIYVGGQNGFNGGGSGKDVGGGASDIRLGSPELNGRIIVAGGGGGTGGRSSSGAGGYGGGGNSSGGTGADWCGSPGTGGTLTRGGSGGDNHGYSGGIGYGGSAGCVYSGNGSAGGGGGYYGGGGGGHDCPRYNDYDDSGAGGGSGYIDTSYFTSMGGQNGVRSGNGYVQITAVNDIKTTVSTVVTTPQVSFNTSNLLIAAGGGGGGDNDGGTLNGADDGRGGVGGGTSGGNARINGAITSGSAAGSNSTSIGAIGTGRGGTQNGGYRQGLGESATSATDTGGAGGGWWGGLITNHNDGGAGGGSGYTNTSRVQAYTYTSPNGSKTTYPMRTVAGSNNGNGKARISFIESTPGGFPTPEQILEVIDKIPENSELFICDRKNNAHVCDNLCQEISVLNCSEPHHSGNHYQGDELCYTACHDDAKHKTNTVINTADGSFTPGNFINIDWGFRIYYDNFGDFFQSNTHGIGQLTNTRGMGYVNGMDTTIWTRQKQVKFPVNVIYEGNLYIAGEWITLADKGEYQGEDGSPYNEKNWTYYGHNIYDNLRGNMLDGRRNYVYDFYCVEANKEQAMAPVEVRSFGINNPRLADDSGGQANFSQYVTNRIRAGNRNISKHTTFNTFSIDIVGRIGNLAMIDTADYRFSNLFKQTVASDIVVPDPVYYTVTSKDIEPTNKELVEVTSDSINSRAAGEGAVLRGIEMPAGSYKVYIKGSNLLNSTLSLITRTSWDSFATLDTSTGLVHTATDHYESINGAEPIKTSVDGVISGPGIELKAGQYNIQITGNGFNNTNWEVGTGSAENFVSHPEWLSGPALVTGEVITMSLDIPNDVNGFSVYCSYNQISAIEVGTMNIYRLDIDAAKDIGVTGNVTSVVSTDDLRVYYVKIDTATTLDVQVLSRGLPISVNAIGIQDTTGSSSNNWTVEGLVGRVDLSQQRAYLTYGTDIRGVELSHQTRYIDTYTTMPWANKALCMMTLPLTASQNNIDILKDEPLLIGYDTYLSINTIGEYYRNGSGFLQVIPEYYAVNIKTNEIAPVDIYVQYNNGYYPINVWGLVTGEDNLTWGAGGSGYSMDLIYNLATLLDWGNESVRRMVSPAEEYMTSYLKYAMAYEDQGVTHYLNVPSLNTYIMGNPQFLQLNGKARTFVGGERTYFTLMNYNLGTPNIDWPNSNGTGVASSVAYEDETNGIVFNPNGRIQADDWWQKSQRWHFTLSIPSSAVFVEAGHQPTLEEIAKYQTRDYVILSTVDIRSLGEVWNLRYWEAHNNIQVADEDGIMHTVRIPDYINLNGVNHRIPTLITIYSTTDRSELDIDIVSTH